MVDRTLERKFDRMSETTIRRAHALRIVIAAGLLVTLLITVGCAIDPMIRLEEQVEAEDVEVRRSAVLALANLDDQRTVLTLTDVLERDEELRDMAAAALVKKGRELVTDRKPDPIIEGIAALANNVHLEQEVRARAAWMLGEIGDREAIPALKTASGARLTDGSAAPLVREQANHALEKLGYKSDGRPFEIPMGSVENQQLTTIPTPKPLQPDEEEETA